MTRITLSFVLLLACFTLVMAGQQRAVLDFDGDNKTDYAVMRSADPLAWYLQQSTDGFRGQAWGTSGDRLVPGDYDGDMKWDIAVWRSGVFYILQSSDSTLSTVWFGQGGTTPDRPHITQDFDGDGKVDPAVTRLTNGVLTWHILQSRDGYININWGNGNDRGVRGDFDGDGRADVAVYRNQSGTTANTYYVLKSGGGTDVITFGDYTIDTIAPSDFDGDGKSDYAHFRGTNGSWYWIKSTDGSSNTLSFGIGTDQAVPGDYDGDGKSDQAVYRLGSEPIFHVNKSISGPFSFPFGQNNDVAIQFDLLSH